MSIDGKRPTGSSGSGNSPPHKRGRLEDEETPMEVDTSDDDVTSTSQQGPSTVTQSTSTQTQPTSSDQPSGSAVDQSTQSVSSSSGNVSEGASSAGGSAVNVVGGDATASTTSPSVPPSGGEDVPAAKISKRSTLVARKGRPKQEPQSDYKTYSDSVVGKDVAIKPLSPKPACLLPSDQSINFDEKVVDVPPPSPPSQAVPAPQPDDTDQPAAAPPAPMQPAVIPPVHPAVPGAVGQHQQTAEIVITYPDGRREVIEVVNAEHVSRVARAGQVLRPIDSGLSASVPQTSKPQPVSTASLPASLGAASTLPAALAPGQDDTVADDVQNVPQDQVADPNAPQSPPATHTAPEVSDSSVQQQNPAKPVADKKSKKAKKNAGEYHSCSAPALPHQPPTTQPPNTFLLSTPILSMTQKLKKKVATTLDLLKMKDELDRIAAEVLAIQEEANLSDEDKKGDKDSDLKDDEKEGGKD